MTLISGSTSVLYCEPSYDGDKVCQLLQDEKAMVILIIGDAMARPIVDSLSGNPNKYNLSNLFVLSSGGAILSKSVKTQLQRLLPNIMLINGFGSSETGHMGSVETEHENIDSPCFTVGADTKVLDPETLEEIVAGSTQAGVFARAGYIPQSYYKDEVKTAETFKVDGNGIRWRRSPACRRISALRRWRWGG